MPLETVFLEITNRALKIARNPRGAHRIHAIFRLKSTSPPKSFFSKIKNRAKIAKAYFFSCSHAGRQDLNLQSYVRFVFTLLDFKINFGTLTEFK